MGYDGIDNAIDGLSEIELQLKVRESNHEKMISTQDDIIQGQKWISTMVEKLLTYMESLGTVQHPQFESKGHEEKNDAKLGSFDGTMGVVRHYIW
jgi:hypothetical protein